MQAQTMLELATAAFAIALNPPAVVAVILMLSPTRPKRTALSFVAGWMVGLLIVGAAVLLAGEVSDLWSVAEWLAMALRIALGLSLVVLAVIKWLKHRSSAPSEDTPEWMRSITELSARRAFAVAAAFAALNPKTLALNVAGVVVILDAGLPVAREWAALAVFVTASSLSVAGPVIYQLAAPRSAEPVLEASKGWLVENSAVVTSVVLLLLGLVVLGEGIQAFVAR